MLYLYRKNDQILTWTVTFSQPPTTHSPLSINKQKWQTVKPKPSGGCENKHWFQSNDFFFPYVCPAEINGAATIKPSLVVNDRPIRQSLDPWAMRLFSFVVISCTHDAQKKLQQQKKKKEKKNTHWWCLSAISCPRLYIFTRFLAPKPTPFFFV